MTTLSAVLTPERLRMEDQEVWALVLLSQGEEVYRTYARTREYTARLLRSILYIFDVYDRVELVNTATGEREMLWQGKEAGAA